MDQGVVRSLSKISQKNKSKADQSSGHEKNASQNINF